MFDVFATADGALAHDTCSRHLLNSVSACLAGQAPLHGVRAGVTATDDDAEVGARLFERLRIDMGLLGRLGVILLSAMFKVIELAPGGLALAHCPQPCGRDDLASRRTLVAHRRHVEPRVWPAWKQRG